MIKTTKEWKPKVVPHETTCSSTCLMSKEDEVKLWHQKLGHLNLKGISLGYSTSSRAYRVFNSRTKGMVESINVVVDDSIIVKWTDVDEDVGTSSQQTDASENMEDIESNIELERNESNAFADI